MKKYLLAVMLAFAAIPLCAQSAGDLQTAVLGFISTLPEDQANALIRDFNEPARAEWTNLPVGMAPRPGIRYGDLNEEGKIAFHQVLLSLLSSQGYLKVNNIMHLDDYLLNIYEIAYSKGQMDDETKAMIEKLDWGHGNYYISLWGDPQSDRWSLKFEGHHISLNISVIGQELTMAPLFLGTDPALVRETQFAGIRSLAKEEDYGLELMNLLTEAQREKAVISDEVPGDIITSPGNENRLAEYQGIKGSELTVEQRLQLEFIIMEYLGNFERAKKEYYQKLVHARGLDEVYFGWIGGTERVTDHYYVINSPDILIEYDNVGWIYRGDHIHTIFRDKKNDFAEDLLRKHYLEHKH